MNVAPRLGRATVFFAALFAGSIGCVEAPPKNLIGGGAGDSLSRGQGGSDATSTDDSGSGGERATGSNSTSPSSAAAGGGGDSGEGTFTVSFDDRSPASDLMDDAIVHVTLTPKNGFSDDIELAAFELPDGVSATFSDDMPHLAGSAKTVKLTLHVDNTVMVGSASFSVTAHGTTLTKSASGTLKVNPSITLHIPANVLALGGTQQNPFKTAYGPYPIVINANGKMVTVNFMNDDAAAHEIHSDSTFGHDPGLIPAHTMDSFVRQVPMGQYDFYLHDQGNSGTPGQIVIQ